MKLLNIETKEEIEGIIVRVSSKELDKLNNDKNFVFDWSTESQNQVYKITVKDKSTILGLISLIDYPQEFRIHINLIEARKDQRGKHKKIGNIPGCLIAFACREAFKNGYGGFVSLKPKTQLIKYYQKYRFVEVGMQMAIAAQDSKKLISKYFDDEEI